MPTEKGKITIRQMLILFVLSTLSPAIRLFPQDCAKIGGISCWTAPLISAITLVFLMALLNVVFRNNKIASLNDFFNLTIGSKATKVVLVFYFIWTSILYFLYIRYYAERLLASIYPNTNIRFFIVLILLLTYVSARGEIETLARFAEISILLFTVVFTIFYIFLIPSTKVSNLLPLTYYDIVPAFKSTYPVIGVWGYITLFYFLGDSIKNRNELENYRAKAIIYLVGMTTLMMITVIGSLGYENAERMPLPFFNATKVISVMQSFDRFEAVLVSIWIISDFIIITVFAKILSMITKKIFNATNEKYFISPIILFGYVGSLYLATNRFELSIFSANIAIGTNIVFCYLIPVIFFVIGKVRKKI